ncbi:hypothetical protein [Winogradskyella flava]|uniref:Beta-lactamase-inhibitor-like, PepSY-like n=1 Tax=Winogradskyella flava TaxID=1884876 RepID=A0A842IPZ7_9FLAO|nr:hypothetical protein [Winogradskyella flava]MBC2843577.1 hypothetical protein [Winogradskyella flava]
MKLNFSMLCFSMVLFAQFSIGQTKNEREERIKISEFPELAIPVVQALPEACKRIKFYKETDGDKHSFEVKFKYNKQRYSLEFSEDGIIEDIEITTRFKRIEEKSKTEIERFLKQAFDKHKLIKIQKQFVYSVEKSASQFINEALSDASLLVPNFEIIAEVRQKKRREIREFTFNDKGLFKNSRILNPTSYEHVLY